MYAEFYDSFIQHPLLLWAAALLGLLIALSRRGLSRSLRWFCVALAILSLLDAWLTSTPILGIGSLTGAAASLVPLAFVLIGDFRYFFFVESARSDGTVPAGVRGWARACGWTLVVPLGSKLIIAALGSDDPRVLFLVYSVGMAALYLPRHSNAPRWTRRVTMFVIGYYGLWAAADAIILTTGADMGFLLRVLPNALYYGGFVPVVAWTAPRQNHGAGLRRDSVVA
ncbi:MAG: hypothetical protein JRF55_17970 [Deltaproteobacteria bacterium]|nr:hypothetical protein [Deltaproteobacteria bacterium]